MRDSHGTAIAPPGSVKFRYGSTDETRQYSPDSTPEAATRRAEKRPSASV
jgi:hypothetical protein